ncbi:MAG: hypothetical protein KAR14_05135, partial [Candidatus Aminicenantes bacterium]|nr:hypothetical protein [Candidatus Aminicenantes bacterium]
MKIFKEFIIRSIFISILLISFPIFANQSETLEKEHLEFYRVGEIIDIGKLLDFDTIYGKRLLSVTISYNMIRSKLSGEWILNGTPQETVKLKRGLKKEITEQFDTQLPSELKFRFHGKRGQIQVRSVSAIVKPVKLKIAYPIIQKKNKKKVYRLAKLKRILPRTRSFDLINPAGGDSLVMGTKVKILWQMTGMERKVFGELWKGNKRIKTIFDDVHGAKGRYIWKVSGKKIVPGGNYKIRLRTMNKRFSAESEIFSISQLLSKLKIMKYIKPVSSKDIKIMKFKEPIALKIIEPVINTQWEIFHNYPIRWESKGLKRENKIGIAIKNRTSKIAKIIAITENTGSYNYAVPYPVSLFGDDVQVIITPLKDRSVEVLSSRFSINKPAVDLVCSSPEIDIVIKKRKRKWWQRLGDIFSGGITFYASKVIDILWLDRAVLHINFKVFNNGSDNLRNV